MCSKTCSTRLLPDHPALGVVHVVHLVKDDPLDVADDVRAAVEHAAEDLGGHDQAGGFGADGHVAREQAHVEARLGAGAGSGCGVGG